MAKSFSQECRCLWGAPQDTCSRMLQTLHPHPMMPQGSRQEVGSAPLYQQIPAKGSEVRKEGKGLS
jgi:hypothetical protein